MNENLTLQIFEPIKDRFIQLINEETFLKESSFALQILTKNKYLAGLDRASIIQAVLNVAQTGLTLNPISRLAYLVPRSGACCLDVSYQGMVKLITDTGSVVTVYSHVIREGDEFIQTLGTSTEIVHNPKLGNKGEIIGVYAVAILKDGTKQIEVMDISEINEIRDSSEGYIAFKSGRAKSAIWNDHFPEMARKTVIKRLAKYLPKTNQWERVNQAINIDNEDYKVQDYQLNIIDELLPTATFSEEKKEFIESVMGGYSFADAQKVIADLKENQTDPIRSGRSYNQTAILDKLK